MRMVWSEEKSAGDIAREFDVTFGAVSQHLSVLRDAGLVEQRKVGRSRFYRAKKEALGPMAAALEAMWSDALDRLKELAESEEAQTRNVKGRSVASRTSEAEGRNKKRKNK